MTFILFWRSSGHNFINIGIKLYIFIKKKHVHTGTLFLTKQINDECMYKYVNIEIINDLFASKRHVWLASLHHRLPLRQIPSGFQSFQQSLFLFFIYQVTQLPVIVCWLNRSFLFMQAFLENYSIDLTLTHHHQQTNTVITRPASETAKRSDNTKPVAKSDWFVWWLVARIRSRKFLLLGPRAVEKCTFVKKTPPVILTGISMYGHGEKICFRNYLAGVYVTMFNPRITRECRYFKYKVSTYGVLGLLILVKISRTKEYII